MTTLEQLKEEGRINFKEKCSFDGVEIDGNTDTFLNSYATTIWNAAIKDALGALPDKLLEADFWGTERLKAFGYNSWNEDARTRLEALRDNT